MAESKISINVSLQSTILDFAVMLWGHAFPEDFRTQGEVFEEIFLVFLVLGTLVGVVVVGYMLWNGYKYREGATPAEEFEQPVLGELPTGGKGGKKLFVSFAISAIIVISLVAWTYMALIYVEAGAAEEMDADLEVHIEGNQWFWMAEYPSGETMTTDSFGEDESYIAIPQGQMVELNVTANNVWHTFGVTELRLKVDAIPGQNAHSWIAVDEQGLYHIECFELCGVGHSAMDGTLKVMDPVEFEEAYGDNDEEENED